MFSLRWIKRNFQQLSHVADYRLTIVFTIEIITYVTYCMSKTVFTRKLVFKTRGLMLRLDLVVRNCKDEIVNISGNIGEEIKELQEIKIQFLLIRG